MVLYIMYFNFTSPRVRLTPHSHYARLRELWPRVSLIVEHPIQLQFAVVAILLVLVATNANVACLATANSVLPGIFAAQLIDICLCLLLL